MNSFFILGRVPELSLLEMRTVLNADYPRAALEECGIEAVVVSGDLPAQTLIERLGGSIKGGRVGALNAKDFDAATQHIVHDIMSRAQNARGRVTFGISAYSVSQKVLKGNEARRIHAWIQKTGITIKKMLREQNASARFVAPRKGACTLSSVVITKNHLTALPNCEYVLLIGDSSLAVGTTEAVQDFEAYSYRDYHRPHRDMKTGLLPPKLARMMINCAGVKKDGVIFDPFCGLGTILQEALLLGCANVWGGDINEKNIRATKENLIWLGEDMARTNLKTCDAKKLSSCFLKNSVDAIVTEPTLGPPLSKERPNISRSEINSLCSLYVASFKSFRDVLNEKGRVVIVFPVWLCNGNPVFIPCIDEIMAGGFTNSTIPDSLKNSLPGITSRDSLLIARPDARVARELFIFQKTTR